MIKIKLEDMEISIDGEVYDIDSVTSFEPGMVSVACENMDFYLAVTSERAGELAKEYWANMAKEDPEEFTCLVGEKSLCAWSLGRYAGPGTTQVKALQDWLDLWRNTPEEQWASYDRTELIVDAIGTELLERIGFTPTVAYRNN